MLARTFHFYFFCFTVLRRRVPANCGVHMLSAHVNTCAHTVTICSLTHARAVADSIRFGRKDTQALSEAVRSQNGPFSPASP